VRHPLESVKQEMSAAVKAVCEEEARSSGMEITWIPYPNNLAAAMSSELKDLLVHACKQLGYSYNEMSSGAGHDTLNMAKLGKVGMLFIPCKDGRSHCPEESASFEDMEKGINVLKACLYELAYKDVLSLGQKDVAVSE